MASSTSFCSRRIAKLTSGPHFAAFLMDEAVHLKSQVEEVPSAADVKPRRQILSGGSELPPATLIPNASITPTAAMAFA
jgi:hypothetical protein